MGKQFRGMALQEDQSSMKSQSSLDNNFTTTSSKRTSMDDGDLSDNGGSEKGEYVVETILAVRTINGRKEYLVKWRGYDETECTWEPPSNFNNCDEMIRKIELENAAVHGETSGVSSTVEKTSSNEPKPFEMDDDDWEEEAEAANIKKSRLKNVTSGKRQRAMRKYFESDDDTDDDRPKYKTISTRKRFYTCKTKGNKGGLHLGRKKPQYLKEKDDGIDEPAIPTKILCARREKISNNEYAVKYTIQLRNPGDDGSTSFAIWPSDRLFEVNPRLIVDYWEKSAYWPKCHEDNNELMDEDDLASEASDNPMGLHPEIILESDSSKSRRRYIYVIEDSQPVNTSRLAIGNQTGAQIGIGGENGDNSGIENHEDDIERNSPMENDVEDVDIDESEENRDEETEAIIGIGGEKGDNSGIENHVEEIEGDPPMDGLSSKNGVGDVDINESEESSNEATNGGTKVLKIGEQDNNSGIEEIEPDPPMVGFSLNNGIEDIVDIDSNVSVIVIDD